MPKPILRVNERLAKGIGRRAGKTTFVTEMLKFQNQMLKAILDESKRR